MKCITVSYGLVKGRAKQYRYYQPAMYKSYLTKDGRLLWRYVSHLGIARRSLKLAERDALEIIKQTKIEFKSGIRQWNKVDE